jgi:hypothetical protein
VGYVIGAVAVLAPGHDSLGALDRADLIGQPLQVPEWRIRVFHTTAPVGVLVSTEASSR